MDEPKVRAAVRVDKAEELAREIVATSVLAAVNTGHASRSYSPEVQEAAAKIRALCDEVIMERDIEVYHDLDKAQKDTERLDIVFDGPPGPVAGRFVEVEDANGRSVSRGEWIKRDDGYWVLRIIAARALEEKP